MPLHLRLLLIVLVSQIFARPVLSRPASDVETAYFMSSSTQPQAALVLPSPYATGLKMKDQAHRWINDIPLHRVLLRVPQANTGHESQTCVYFENYDDYEVVGKWAKMWGIPCTMFHPSLFASAGDRDALNAQFGKLFLLCTSYGGNDSDGLFRSKSSSSSSSGQQSRSMADLIDFVKRRPEYNIEEVAPQFIVHNRVHVGFT
jgi:hypothetical protein